MLRAPPGRCWPVPRRSPRRGPIVHESSRWRLVEECVRTAAGRRGSAAGLWRNPNMPSQRHRAPVCSRLGLARRSLDRTNARLPRNAFSLSCNRQPPAQRGRVPEYKPLGRADGRLAGGSLRLPHSESSPRRDSSILVQHLQAPGYTRPDHPDTRHVCSTAMPPENEPPPWKGPNVLVQVFPIPQGTWPDRGYGPFGDRAEGLPRTASLRWCNPKGRMRLCRDYGGHCPGRGCLPTCRERRRPCSDRLLALA